MRAYPKLLALALASAPFAVVPFATQAAVPADQKLSISANPNPIVFELDTVISGKRTGPVKAGHPVALEDNPFPYTRGFQKIASTVTDARARYKFSHVKPLLNTRYRTTTPLTGTGKVPPPEGSSPTILVKVEIHVLLRVSDHTPRPGQRVNFSGTATPQHDGRLVYIQVQTSTGRWHTVARTALRDAGTERSRFSRRIRVRRDHTYRARVFHDGDHADGTSRNKHVNVKGR